MPPSEQLPDMTLEQAREFIADTTLPPAIFVWGNREKLAHPPSATMLHRARESYTADFYVYFQAKLHSQPSDLGPEWEEVFDHALQIVQKIRTQCDAVMRHLWKKPESLFQKITTIVINAITLNLFEKAKEEKRENICEDLVAIEHFLQDNRLKAQSLLYLKALRDPLPELHMVGRVRSDIEKLFDPAWDALRAVEARVPGYIPSRKSESLSKK